jgi:2-dehydro-3-deoxy-D-pentonate aldolase
MKQTFKACGVVVPVVTPITPAGQLDEPALERVVDYMVAGGVDGVFVIGTTGEGGAVPRSFRRRMVEVAVKRAAKRTRIYAGVGDMVTEDAAYANSYLEAGADAIVARAPVSHPLDQLFPWFKALLDNTKGPVVIYNIPSVTNLSIPIEVVEKLVGHPRLAGMKDSEKNQPRLEELLSRFGSRPEFSILVGVGALMEHGLKLGAEGIVPSVGNLVPDACAGLWAAAQKKDWAAGERCTARMNEVAALYQKGRNLGQSLAALKAAMAELHICGTHMLPPLQPLPEKEYEGLRQEMKRLGLLNAAGQPAIACLKK